MFAGRLSRRVGGARQGTEVGEFLRRGIEQIAVALRQTAGMVRGRFGQRCIQDASKPLQPRGL